jgi:hypothetical protein
MPRILLVFLFAPLLAACAVSPHIPEDDSEYVYSVNPDVADLFPPDQVPFGVVFYFYDQPTGVSPVPEKGPATVFVGMDGFRVRVAIEPGDTRRTVALRLARAYKFKGVRCSVHPTGDWIACLSPFEEDVHSVSMQSLDTGMSIGSGFIKD